MCENSHSIVSDSATPWTVACLCLYTPVAHFFDYYSFKLCFRNRKYESFTYLESLEIPYKFLVGIFYACKKCFVLFCFVFPDFDTDFTEYADYYYFLKIILSNVHVC